MCINTRILPLTCRQCHLYNYITSLNSGNFRYILRYNSKGHTLNLEFNVCISILLGKLKYTYLQLLTQFSCNVVLSTHVHADVFICQCLREETIGESAGLSTAVQGPIHIQRKRVLKLKR